MSYPPYHSTFQKFVFGTLLTNTTQKHRKPAVLMRTCKSFCGGLKHKNRMWELRDDNVLVTLMVRLARSADPLTSSDQLRPVPSIPHTHLPVAEHQLGTGQAAGALPDLICKAETLGHRQQSPDDEDVGAFLHLLLQDPALPLGQDGVHTTWGVQAKGHMIKFTPQPLKTDQIPASLIFCRRQEV